MKAKPMKLTEENVEEYLYACNIYTDHVKISLNNNHAKRVDKLVFMKMKTFAPVTVKKMKEWTPNWKKI